MKDRTKDRLIGRCMGKGKLLENAYFEWRQESKTDTPVGPQSKGFLEPSDAAGLILILTVKGITT